MTTNSKEYAKAYYQAHKEQLKAYQRAYQKKKRGSKIANPWLLDTRVDYKTPTREDFKAVACQPELTYSQKYYAENKERIRAKQKETRERNKRLQKQRAYYAENRDRILAQQRAYQRKKTEEKRMSKTFLGRLKLKFKSLFK